MKIRTLRRLRWGFHAVTATSLVAIMVITYVWPWAMWRMHADEYRRLVVDCDQAMHDEVVLRDAAQIQGASVEAARLLHVSGAVSLTVCHQYDKLRKQLLIAGVSEHRLALLGLEGLEVERIPVSPMVEPHRMPRF
jgi:hypothetical protein